MTEITIHEKQLLENLLNQHNMTQLCHIMPENYELAYDLMVNNTVIEEEIMSNGQYANLVGEYYIHKQKNFFLAPLCFFAAIHNGYYESYLNLYLYYSKYEKNDNAAKKCVEKIMKKDTNGKMLVKLAIFNSESDKSVQYFNMALLKDNFDPTTLYLLGIHRKNTNNHAEMIKCFVESAKKGFIPSAIELTKYFFEKKDEKMLVHYGKMCNNAFGYNKIIMYYYDINNLDKLKKYARLMYKNVEIDGIWGLISYYWKMYKNTDDNCYKHKLMYLCTNNIKKYDWHYRTVNILLLCVNSLMIDISQTIKNILLSPKCGKIRKRDCIIEEIKKLIETYKSNDVNDKFVEDLCNMYDFVLV